MTNDELNALAHTGGVSEDTAHPEALRSFAEAVAATELEKAARLCELKQGDLLLLFGEMTASELRTVKAVLANRAAAIRSLWFRADVANARRRDSGPYEGND